MKKVAFIGTGLMGAPMAQHVLEAGYELIVHNRTRARAQFLIDAGARWAETPVEAVREADLTITIVGYPSEVEELYLGENGLIEAARPGSFLVDMSTSSPELARDIYQAAAVRDVIAFDAPVTGGEFGAKQGTLTIMVGANQETLDQVLPVFESFGKVIIPFGEAGKGQLAKLTNQIAIAGNMLAMAESLSFAKSVGIQPEAVLPILQSGSAGSVALSLYAPLALEGNYEPGFKVEHLCKDLRIALSIAEEEELELPGLEVAYGVYDILYNINGGARGTQAITLVYDKEEAAEAAGLDWNMLAEEYDAYFEEGDMSEEESCSCGCGEHTHHDDHACGCSEQHDHDDHVCGCNS